MTSTGKIVCTIWLSSRGLTSGYLRKAISVCLRIVRRVSPRKYQTWIQFAQDEHSRRIHYAKVSLIESLEIPDVDAFIDIGAHEGQETIPAASIVATFAFEPSSVALDKLRLNLSSVPTIGNVTLVNAAAWDDDGEGQLFEHSSGEPGSESASLFGEKRNVNSSRSETCRLVDIGRFVNELPYTRIVMKINAEGAEYRILRRLYQSGAVSKIHTIFCSYHDRKIPGLWLEGLRFDLLRWSRRRPVKFVNWE